MPLSRARAALRAVVVAVTLATGVAAVTTQASAATVTCTRKAHVGRVIDSKFGPLRCTRVAAGRYRWRAVPVAAAPAAPRGQVAEATAAEAWVTEAWVTEMLQIVNAQRAASGVGPLALCRRLTDQAQAHAVDQAVTGIMSHIGSDGSTLKDRAQRSGYLDGANGWTIGENVAYGYTEVGAVMDAWMASAGHRANLLLPAYTHVGLAKANGTSLVFWAQEFGVGGTC